MYSSFGRMNSSQTNFDLINAVHAHRCCSAQNRVKQTGKPDLSVTFLTGNTCLLTPYTVDVITAHDIST